MYINNTHIDLQAPKVCHEKGGLKKNTSSTLASVCFVESCLIDANECSDSLFLSDSGASKSLPVQRTSW